jgi:hypothetical protein
LSSSSGAISKIGRGAVLILVESLKHNLQVGDLVLEIDDNPDTAWNAAVRGPYKTLQFLQEGALVAVLARLALHSLSPVHDLQSAR